MRLEYPFVSKSEHSTAKIAKNSFTWLHLSDWHQGLPDFDRGILLEKMLEDVRRRAPLDSRLSEIDAVIFSGDIAYSGKESEYAAVESGLIGPLREILGSETSFIFAPGNHDLDRAQIAEIPAEWEKLITARTAGRRKQIGDMLYDSKKAPTLLAPFDSFYAFSNRNGCSYAAAGLVSSKTFANSRVGVVTINTATCCARHSLAGGADGAAQPWDYGTLSISERQLRQAMEGIKDCKIKFLVMHHPISWMHESEQPVLEQLIADHFDLVLYGHEHLPRFSSVSGNFGDIKFVPAGCSYAGRTPENPRYTNAYNFGVVDLNTEDGAIYHRQWQEERDRWHVDDRYWPEGVARFLIQKHILPGNKGYIFDALRSYKPYHSKRPAKNAEITLTHTPTKIDGRDFLEATVRYKLQLHPGDAEKYTFRTITNKRTMEDASQEVRERAFSVVSMVPKPASASKEGNADHRILGSVDLSGKSATIEYHYRMLETNFGVWFFTLGRFTDKVRFQLMRAEGYEYEFMPLGGFPNLQPGKDGLLHFESLESEGGHLPGQGYMVQWYRK
jgi:predicted phosphodiesterase